MLRARGNKNKIQQELRMSNFERSLRKTVELKNHSVPNDKAPSQTEKEKFSSINLLTVIVLWSPNQTTHQEASFSILQAGGQTTESGELPPSPT